MKIKWNEENINILKECYPTNTWEDILRKLKTKNRPAISSKASKLKIKREYKEDLYKETNRKIRTPYTKEEDNYMIENYNKMFANQIAKNLNRSYFSITNRLSQLGIEKNVWSDKNMKILRKVYPKYTNKYIQENYFPNRSIASIRTQGNKNGMIKLSEDKNKWYVKEDILEKLRVFTKELGRSPTYAEIDANPNLPSSKTFERYFGALSKIVMAWGVIPNSFIYSKGIGAISSNGEKCDSNAEYIITEYLIKNNIDYHKTVKYSEYIDDNRCSTKTCDWVINGVFVEYFGLPEKPAYYKKMEIKRQILKENNVKLIELFKQDLNKLDNKLKTLSQ